MELTKFILIIVGLVVTSLGIIYAIRRYYDDKKKTLEEAIKNVGITADRKLDEHIKSQEDCVDQIKQSLARLEAKMVTQETKMGLFWGAIETNFGKLLKSFPTDIDKDVLITKMIEKRLNLKEANTLKEIFINELELKKIQDKGEIITYTWLIAALDQRIYDLEKGRIHADIDDCTR